MENHGTSPFLDGNINYFYGHGFNSKLLVITRGYVFIYPDRWTVFLGENVEESLRILLEIFQASLKGF